MLNKVRLRPLAKSPLLCPPCIQTPERCEAFSRGENCTVIESHHCPSKHITQRFCLKRGATCRVNLHRTSSQTQDGCEPGWYMGTVSDKVLPWAWHSGGRSSLPKVYLSDLNREASEQIWPVWAYKKGAGLEPYPSFQPAAPLSSPPHPLRFALSIPRDSQIQHCLLQGAPKPGKLESTARNLLKALQDWRGTRERHCACVQCGQPGLTLHLLPTAFHYSIQTQHGPWEIS